MNYSSTKNESALHKTLVASLVSYVGREGVRVTHADLPSHATPHAMGRHAPDVLGVDSRGVIVIGEAKTGDEDLFTLHTQEQLQDFATTRMTSTGTPCPFYLLVPENARFDAIRSLRQAGVWERANVRLVLES